MTDVLSIYRPQMNDFKSIPTHPTLKNTNYSSRNNCFVNQLLLCDKVFNKKAHKLWDIKWQCAIHIFSSKHNANTMTVFVKMVCNVHHVIMNSDRVGIPSNRRRQLKVAQMKMSTVQLGNCTIRSQGHSFPYHSNSTPSHRIPVWLKSWSR